MMRYHKKCILYGMYQSNFETYFINKLTSMCVKTKKYAPLKTRSMCKTIRRILIHKKRLSVSLWIIRSAYVDYLIGKLAAWHIKIHQVIYWDVSLLSKDCMRINELVWRELVDVPLSILFTNASSV